MRVFVFSVLALIASATSPPLVIHERRYAPSGLSRGRRVDETSVVTFQIGLKQTNLENAYEYLMNISHPTSPHYGKLWSLDDIRNTFAPSKETTDTVREWLADAEIDGITEHHGWLSFQSTVGYVENILKAEFFEHEEDDSETVRIGCDIYHLPDHISKHVDYITPGVALSPPMRKRSLSKRQPLPRGGAQPRWPGLNAKHAPRRPVEPVAERSTEPEALSRRSAQLPPDLRDCGRGITPVCVRALYGLPSPQEVATSYGNTPENALGIFEAGGKPNQTDLNVFFSLYAPEIPMGTGPTTHFLDAKPNTIEADRINSETDLDLMLAFPIVYPQTITVYQIEVRDNGNYIPPGYAGFHYYLQEFLDAVDASFCKEDPLPHPSPKLECGTVPLTRVISISYGDAEIIQPQSYLHRQCNEYMKLALRGTTVTVASGDYGVASFFGYNRINRGLSNGCIVPGNFTATLTGSQYVGNGTVFSSSWPATCPYVLSVGATQLGLNSTVGDPESVMDLTHYAGIYAKDDYRFASSGGFSNYFSRPSYQDKAIDSYFAKHDPGYPYYTFNGVELSQPGNNIGANGGLYNRAGRGVPDVSAIGRHVSTIYASKPLVEAGTSCSAPIWGSIITLINEKRTLAGKSPVGFVNPVLYEHPEAFYDVTLGRNPGCFTKGFSAVEGWDPATGLGTPNFPKLLDVFMNLP